MKKSLLGLEKNLFKPKKYCNYDDTEYEWIGDVRNLFNPYNDKDYYKQLKTVSDFDNNNMMILNMKVKEIKIKFHQL